MKPLTIVITGVLILKAVSCATVILAMNLELMVLRVLIRTNVGSVMEDALISVSTLKETTPVSVLLVIPLIPT